MVIVRVSLAIFGECWQLSLHGENHCIFALNSGPSCVFCSHRKKSCSTSSYTVYIFYCCITKGHHKLSSLKEHTSIISVSTGQGCRHNLSSSSTQGLMLQSRHQLCCIHIWRLDWGRIHFQTHLVCCQNSFYCRCITQVCFLACCQSGATLSS